MGKGGAVVALTQPMLDQPGMGRVIAQAEVAGLGQDVIGGHQTSRARFGQADDPKRPGAERLADEGIAAQCRGIVDAVLDQFGLGRPAQHEGRIGRDADGEPDRCALHKGLDHHLPGEQNGRNGQGIGGEIGGEPALASRRSDGIRLVPQARLPFLATGFGFSGLSEP